MPGKAKPKAKAAGKPRKAAASSKSPRKASAKAKPGAGKARPAKARSGQKAVVLLSGGNPQIPKGDGDAPVQAYIAAMPGWKRDVGKRLDALIARAVPDVRKAVKWNSPFYGVEGQGWFLSFHVFARYVKVTFFRGASLRPLPPRRHGEEQGRALGRRPRGRPRRGADGGVGEAGRRDARLDHLSGKPPARGAQGRDGARESRRKTAHRRDPWAPAPLAGGRARGSAHARQGDPRSAAASSSVVAYRYVRTSFT